MNKVYGFVLGLILMATVGAQESDSSTFPTSNWSNEDRVTYVCAVLEKNCNEIIEAGHYPQIVYTDISPTYGLYVPSVPDVIFINQNLPKEFQAAVILHELTHFLHYHYVSTGLWPNFESCDTEGLAFKVSNRAYQDFGIGEDRSDWYWGYGCQPE